MGSVFRRGRITDERTHSPVLVHLRPQLGTGGVEYNPRNSISRIGENETGVTEVRDRG